jgi:undecaprenyl-diphosphatase
MDQKLLLLINSTLTSPGLDRFMATMSSFDFWAPFFIVGGLAVAVWGRFRARAFLVIALVSVAFADGFVGNQLKQAVDRPRPFQAISGVRQVDLAKASPRLLALGKPLRIRLAGQPELPVAGRSFPSSHAANTMCLAVLATLFFPRRGWLAILVALVVAYSRIYTGSHWPSDVAASVFLGAGIALLTAAVAEFGWRRQGAHVLPTLHHRYPSLLTS